MPAIPKLVDHVVEGDLVDLCDELCIGVELSVEGEEDILLVKSGEGHKGISVGQAFFQKKIPITSVPVYDISTGNHLA